MEGLLNVSIINKIWGFIFVLLLSKVAPLDSATAPTFNNVN